MCGIVGYLGKENALPILLDGLRRLEYRGYDSAGIAILKGERIALKRSVGKLANLEQSIDPSDFFGRLGVGHTRWATHGRPSEANAHPHVAGRIAVVHNGIIENYLALKDMLSREGHHFHSETDTEVISHLVEKFLKEGNPLEEAVKKALSLLQGSYAIALIYEGEPQKLVGARLGSSLVIGERDGNFFLASDIPAILSHTRDIIFLEDGEIVFISPQDLQVIDPHGRKIRKILKRIDWTPIMAEKGGFRHFMHKEIHEQPRVVIDSFRGRISLDEGEVFFEEAQDLEERLKEITKIFIVACGTSWHAALVGKFLIEDFSKISVEVDLGSEFRYRDPLLDNCSILILISQSGETADTLAALREGKKKGAYVLSICNVVDSSMARESQGVIYTRAGPEIGVASTKAFTTQLVVLYLLAIFLGRKLSRLNKERAKEMLDDLVRLPQQMEKILKEETKIEAIGRKYFNAKDFLYLGRGINYPIALEGALKLKEISYIHAEGYPAGEMKHGPIALIDEDCPVVALAPKDKTYEKIMNNIEEVKSRDGKVIVVSNWEDEDLNKRADDFICIPWNSPFLTPILLVTPLQLLAYHIAVLKGTDVDQPRNLAKSVTVE